MQREDSESSDAVVSAPKVVTSSHVVTADSVQAEEVPTIPLGSLQTLSTLQPEVSIHSVASTQIVSMPAPLVVQPSEYRRSLAEWFQVWWDGFRPAYLPLSVMLFLLGSTLAWTQSLSVKTPVGQFHPTRFLVTFAAILLLQSGAHLVNDYHDYIKGVDTSNTLGPGGLIQQGLIKPSRVLSLGLILLSFGALLGVVLAFEAGPLIFLFVLVGLLCAYFYSATSQALSSLALGELVSFCIFGPLITLSAYLVQTDQVNRTVLLYSIPLGLFATAVIYLNNMRDAESDAAARKHTLAGLLGLGLNRVLFLLLLLGAYAIVVALGVPRQAPHLLLITLWTLPTLVIVITGALRTDTPPGIHLVMRQTLRLETYFALLLIVALIVSAFWPILPHLTLPV